MRGRIRGMSSRKTSPITTLFKVDTSALDKASGKLSGLGKATGAAAIGGGAAVAAFATKSAQAFMGFEQGMSEVFTLMPGISEQAMGKMEGQVKDFSKEFGVLPEDTIPALYDSLSAGIPEENVFKFMEDAQKLAVAGNVTTADSVDLLTTVVNAYGLEASEAGRVSDIMFSVVKQGKTTVEELGASIFQVAPIAGQMGVSLEDVGASMAGLTAVGVPTSVAANSLKAVLGELSKPTSVASKAFAELSGQSFPDFIAGGGEMSDAMKIMSEGAEESGVSVGTMFGSLEAGNAFSALANDIEGFDSAVGEMKDSAGATDEAFETMSQTASFQFGQLKAKFNVFMIEVGAKIMPVILKAIDFIGPRLEVLGQIFQDKLSPGIKKVGDFAKEFFKKLESGESFISSFTRPLTRLWESIESLYSVFMSTDPFKAFEKNSGQAGEVMDSLVMLFGSFVDYIRDVVKTIEKLWVKYGDRIMEIISNVFGFVMDVASQGMQLLSAVFDLFGEIVDGDWRGAWNVFGVIVDQATELAKTILSGALDAFVAILKAVGPMLWEAAKAAFFGILGAMQSVWTEHIWPWILAIPENFDAGMEMLPGMLEAGGIRALTALKDGGIWAWQNVVWPFIKQIPGWVLEGSQALPGILLGVGELMIKGIALGAKVGWVIVKTFFTTVPGLILDLFLLPHKILFFVGEKIIGGMKDGLVAAWGAVIGWLSGRKDAMKQRFSMAGQMLRGVGGDIIDGLKQGLVDKWQGVQNWLHEKANAIPGVFRGQLDINSPSGVFMDIGANVIDGLNEGLKKPVITIDSPGFDDDNNDIRPPAPGAGFSPFSFGDLSQPGGVSSGGPRTVIENQTIQVNPGDEGVAESIAWKFETMV